MFRHVNAVANIWIPVAKNEENMRVDCVFGPEFFFFFLLKRGQKTVSTQ